MGFILGNKCPYCGSEHVERYHNSIVFDEETGTFRDPHSCFNCGLEFFVVFEYKEKGFERELSDWSPTYKHDGVCVCLSFCDEGLNGDYIEDDPDDVPLLRFTVYRSEDGTHDYDAVDDGSCCTMIPKNASDGVTGRACEFIHEKVVGLVLEGSSIKKICEDLSNIDAVQFSRETLWKAKQPLPKNV